MPQPQAPTRRQILRRSLAASALFAAPAIIPASALGSAGRPAPSERITMGVVGAGNQGMNDINAFLQDERVQIIAVCDVNRESAGYWGGTVRGREPVKAAIEARYASQSSSNTYKGCDTYLDFREMYARKDIDTVLLALPDHWHSISTIEAASAGKDIYGEKPLSLTIPEGRAMSDAVSRFGRIFQTGSQQRSDARFRHACELVRNGRLGRLHTVRVGLPGGTPDYGGGTGDYTDPQPVPDGFDYDRWLGPAPWAPYCPARCHVNFRWVFDYSGGQLTDWAGHHVDIAQWGMGTELTGPVRIENPHALYSDHPVWNTAVDYRFEAVYESGVRMIVSSRERGGVTFEGTDGWVWVTRGAIDAQRKSLLTSVIGPDETRLYDSRDHFRNFIDCVRTRAQPIAPIENAHRSISIAHLGNIAMKLGRGFGWDPARERILGDDAAQKMLTRAMRSPWGI